MGETGLSTSIYICQSLGDWINLLIYMAAWVMVLFMVFFRGTKISSNAKAIFIDLLGRVWVYLVRESKLLNKFKAFVKFIAIRTISLSSNRLPYFVKTFNNKLKSWWNNK